MRMAPRVHEASDMDLDAWTGGEVPFDYEAYLASQQTDPKESKE